MEARMKEVHQVLVAMRTLKPKVDNANASAAKAFDRGYAKLFDLGQKAEKAAERLLKSAPDPGKGFKGDEKENREAARALVEDALGWWRRNDTAHLKAQDAFAHTKMQQAEQTAAYAMQLDAASRGFINAVVHGDDKVVDDWRGW